jgi:hypothetical protein
MRYDYESDDYFFWDPFVPINNVDKSLSAIDRMIKDNRNKNNGKIDPELAYAILTYTNHCGHIKPIIKNIKEKCADKDGKLIPEQVKEYADFIIASVDGRKQPESVMRDLREFADICNIRKCFNDVDENNKIYEISDCKNVIELKNIKNVTNSEEKITVLLDTLADLSSCDLSKFKRIVSANTYTRLDLSRAYNFPENLDLTGLCAVRLFCCNLAGVKEIKFADGADVDLSSTENLPEILDVSMCKKVNFSGCDMANVKILKYKNKAQELQFTKTDNLNIYIKNYCQNVEYVEDEKNLNHTVTTINVRNEGML